ncbi:LuxR C-terminal-related transcriptional regulator [Olsenella uli]|uniref:LuxR C-terminal-related transcriptional regulator n=1 Tax=Olsenella uli TaxID=133926 RepID=UPI003C6E156D
MTGTLAQRHGLSDREKLVLREMLDGSAVRGTGESLGLSMGTIGTYRSRIYKRLGSEVPAARLRLQRQPFRKTSMSQRVGKRVPRETSVADDPLPVKPSLPFQSSPFSFPRCPSTP